MKYLFLLLWAAITVSCTNTNKPSSKEQANKDSLVKANALDSANFTQLQWLDSTSQNLGKIKEGSIVEISWKFKNTGNKPLVILETIGSCGCTIAEKPKEPILPGETGVIKARFNSQGQGPAAHKTVTVEANTKGGTTHYLYFSADVTKQ